MSEERDSTEGASQEPKATPGAINSAEQAAEDILKEAYAEAQAEECPEGEACPVHFRVDSILIDEDLKYARFITYSGDYAVITEDNSELENPVFMIKLVLGKVKKADLPPPYESTIFHVGEGTLGDLANKSREAQYEAVVYTATYDYWESLREFHEVTVSALEQGLIELKPNAQGE